MQDALLKLEVTLHIARGASAPQLHIALRIGQERMYVVRSLPAFLRALERGERVAFGKGFALEPSAMRFDRPDLLILETLGEIEAAQRPCEVQGYRAPQDGKFLPLPPIQAKRILRLLMAKPFRLALGADMVDVDCVEHMHLPLFFTLSGGMQGLALSVQMPEDVVPLTEDCMFVYAEGRTGLLASRQRVLLRTLLDHAREGRVHVRFAEKDTERMISELLPQLELAGRVRMEASLEQRLMRLPLVTRVFLDREDAAITARVLFCYGEHEVDPFAPRVGEKASGPLLMRDAVAERSVLDELSRAGFRVRAGKVYLPGAQQTLVFLFEGVQTLMNKAEVFCSDRFRRMRPRKPALSGKLTMRQGMLAFSMTDGEETIEELQALLEALRDRRRYFRLRNGTFLDLEGLEAWQEMAGSLAEAAAYQPAQENGALVMANYRAAYFAQLLGQTDLPIALDHSVREVTDAMQEQALTCPSSLNATLRPYQLRGFAWLHALYRLRMGGILADDMGLGKTLQLIALLCWIREEEGTQRALVIAPTSLIYNWQAEIARFAPELRVHVVEGGQAQRQRQWEDLAAREDVDVIISSYPLIRRDIEHARDLSFRLVALDEAQQIKNAHSMAAVAVKQLRAQARFALTGTPMENHPGELWSIFDFVLPGYLLTQAQFMRRHGEGAESEVLRRKIRPFLLRRLKQDVLQELPDKMDHRVLVDMPPDQRRVYAAAMLRARQRMDNLLATKGMQGSRMEVLSIITELRQICCHPSLCLNGYAGSSGKLDALLDLLPGALENGHRVLLFSQFTSMLRILQKRFTAENIDCLYLDGQTPVKQRLELVNRFNGGEGKVFLISLKAGGAGLNLTGADMVIHFDPWWNPAVEEQATDRAHRIGQTQVVQVIRLITRHTIEEQVYRLGERKRALFDSVVTAGEQMPTQLSEEDIRSLFAES